MPIPRAPKKYVPRAEVLPGIILRKVAYGPVGFTCQCGGVDFDKTKRGMVVSGSLKFIRHAYSCAKCKESYLFIPRFASPGGTIF